MGFANWLDKAFPESAGSALHVCQCCRQVHSLGFGRAFENARVGYSNDLTTGPKLLRPWMLSYRADFGLAQVMEPEELLQLAELYLVEGSFAQIMSLFVDGNLRCVCVCVGARHQFDSPPRLDPSQVSHKQRFAWNREVGSDANQ